MRPKLPWITLLLAGAALGQVDAAEPTAAEARAVYEHARRLAAAGDLSEAATRAEQALALWDSAPRANGPEISRCLTFLGDVYRRSRAYSRAESVLQRGLEIGVESLGPRHPDIATTLTTMGDVAYETRQYEKAEVLYRKGCALREAALQQVRSVAKAEADEVTLRLADSFTRLGLLAMARDYLGSAWPMFQRALVLQQHTLDPAHAVRSADSLRHLALVAELLKNYGEAESLLDRSLNLRIAALDEKHPLVADSLYALGSFYARGQQYDQADALLERALQIDEEVLGKDSREVGSLLSALGRLRLAQQRESDAMAFFMRAFASSEAQLRAGALRFSEADLESIIQGVEEDERHLFSLARAYPNNPFFQRLALTAAVLFKGRSIEEATAMSRALARGLGPRQIETFERLRTLRAEISRRSLSTEQTNPAELKQQLRVLVDEREALETQLLKELRPGYGPAPLPGPFEITRRIADALPGDATFIQFVAYLDKPLPGEPSHRERARYLALVLQPDGGIAAVDLGLAKPIDDAATRLHDSLGNVDPRVDQIASQLYDLAFRPLAPLIHSRRLFVVPDGQLALVPFAALHDGQRFLVDAYDFVYLTSGTDLLPRPEGTYSTSVVVFAAPDFGGRAALERAGAWAALPGTEEEAKAIQGLFPETDVYLHGEASKARLLGLSPPGVLHVATHGYFLEDTRGAEGERAIAMAGGAANHPAMVEDPLLRSGLVMAAPSATAEWGDYLVSALELSGLNLWGTQLVVLSACDTGRGDVKLGQGVYGMRRSLMVAGTETLVVSLWKIDDATTRTLMETYYRNLLAGQGRAAALRGAMLTARIQHPHPHYWAPFIAIGRDAPLRGFASSRSE